jgi:PilZ domain
VRNKNEKKQGEEGFSIDSKSRMKRSQRFRERRRFRRLLLDLPLEYRVLNGPYAHGGLTVNASEAGLRIQSVKNIPVGAKLFTIVLFPRGFELTSFEVMAEVIWKDIHHEEDWEGFHYGLNIVEILEEDREKLKQLLSGQSYPGEALNPF